jgi:putative copper resistance protein D
LQWWCVARGDPWTWAWRPYPGVWIFIGLFALVYWRLAHASAAGAPSRDSARLSAARNVSGVAGLLLLWVTLDWPVAALGAGYLAGVHSLQFVMLAMVIPSLLLLGISDSAMSRLGQAPRALAILSRVTAPAFAAIFFTMVMVATHAPPVLDLLMKSQAGNFLLDVLWLASGFVLAWSLICRVPERSGFLPPLQIIYVFAGTIAHVFIGMWLLSSDFPVYATYELAPRVSPLSALYDQHLAGAVIILLGSPLILIAMTIIFFRWQGTGDER